VEQPLRVAELVAEWLADGRCAHSIFNLKLPMKKRFDEVARCRDAMQQRWQRAGISCSLQFKHLYHDREEITGYAWKSGQSRKKRPGRAD
jgi:23S rRNA (cytidine2498-2'-O)-methyltransferase